MRLRSWGALGAFAVLAALMLSVSAASGADGTSKQLYIVQMLDKPVAAYEGGTAGIPATKPAKGKKINDEDPNVIKYAGYLDGKHSDLAKKVGAKKVYDYRFAYNGFAAQLTEGQAKALAKDSSVISVEQDQISEIDTSNTPDFMGLTGPGGAWSQLGGVGNAGEGVIIGVVDTGIVAEPSELLGQARRRRPGVWPRSAGLAEEGSLPAGRGLPELGLQQEADRRAVLQRRLRRRGHRRAGLPLAARLQRPRQPHGVDGRRQQRHPGDR